MQTSAQRAPDVLKEERAKQLAHYLEQQPESVRSAHKLMKGLEVASLLLPVAAVIAAIAVIAKSASLAEGAIPAALFAIPASFGLWILLVGVHAVLIKAFPPSEFMVKGMKSGSGPLGLRTGRLGVRWGVFTMAAAAADVALWGMGAYAFLNPDILKILVPCIIVYSIGAGLWGSWLRKQTS
jgi:hypothetical protein